MYRGSTVPAKPSVRAVCGATTTVRTGRGCRRLRVLLFLAGGEEADDGQAYQDWFHRAAPSLNATSCRGRKNCAPAVTMTSPGWSPSRTTTFPVS